MQTTVDHSEMLKFSALTKSWWDINGSLRTLHDINPCRVNFITQQVDLSAAYVLDVGCGGGILTEALAKSAANVCGIDPNADAINVAQQHAEQENLPIIYSCIEISQYDAQQFDIITCMEMLEHVVNPEIIISNCAQLLKPGGYLFLSTLNRTCSSYLQAIIGAEYILQILPKQTHDYVKFIKPSELAALVRQYDFDVCSISGIKYNPFTRFASLQQSVQINYLLSCRKI